MAYFDKSYISMFLGVVRKYMQVRGGLSQKDLAEKTEIGVSTMSRFLNQKTKDLDPQIIAKIVAFLDIPLHEIIDFISEENTEKFKKLVAFYKDDNTHEPDPELGQDSSQLVQEEDALAQAFGPMGTAKKSVKARVKVGGKSTTIPFEAQNDESNLTVKEKLDRLSPRQKAYISDFLNLDIEGRDLVVDLGNSLFRYFKQKGVEF